MRYGVTDLVRLVVRNTLPGDGVGTLFFTSPHPPRSLAHEASENLTNNSDEESCLMR